MSFLSIAFLAALPLVAAPILLHLFDRRRNVEIEWGAMQFLMEAATRKTSVRRFQHWIVLLMRMLAVACLIFALARPLAPGAWFAGSDRRETILIIDNSMSTQQLSTETTVFSELIAKAEDHVSQLPSGSMARILTTAPYPAWATPASLRLNAASRVELIERLRELRPTQATSDLPGALVKAIQSVSEDAKLAERRLVLLTDGQRRDWRTDDVSGWAGVSESLRQAATATNLEIIEVHGASSSQSNIAISRIRALRTVVGVKQSFSLAAEVHNHSAAASKPAKAKWLVGGDTSIEVDLPALQPGETHDLALMHSYSEPGVFSVTCHIETNDALVADNSESAVIEVVERVPILLVEGATGFAEMQQDAYLVRAALGQIEGEQSEDWRSVFEPRTVAPEQLGSMDLSGFRAIVVPNMTQFDERTVERLSEFVREGGGLWLSLGPRTNLEEFNKRLFRGGDGLSPVALSKFVDESQEELEQPTINPFLKTHPATAELADNERLDTADVRIAQRIRFQMPAESADVSVILDLTNGEPLALENRLGEGRVIVQALPLRYQWSNLAVSNAFVVMVQSWLAYLTEPKATKHNLMPGEPIALEMANVHDLDATLSSPDGKDVPIAGEPTQRGILFRTSHTSLPGNYALEVGLAGSSIPFHVKRDSVESDLTALTANDRDFLNNSVGLRAGRLVSRPSGPGQRTPLWSGLLVLLIAVMACELVLAGMVSRKRFGLAPIEETTDPSTADSRTLQEFPLGRSGLPLSLESWTSDPQQRFVQDYVPVSAHEAGSRSS